MRASAIARFTATVVFPTPPLPLATAINVFTPGMGIFSCGPIGFGGVGGIRIHHRLRLMPEQATVVAGGGATLVFFLVSPPHKKQNKHVRDTPPPSGARY